MREQEWSMPWSHISQLDTSKPSILPNIKGRTPIGGTFGRERRRVALRKEEEISEEERSNPSPAPGDYDAKKPLPRAK